MNRRLSFFANKVARRILISFVLAALIPIGILGLLSFRQVNDQLRVQTARSLHSDCKDYAMRLLGRLGLAESTLLLEAHHVESSGKGFRRITLDREARLAGQFAGLAVIAPNGEKTPLLGEIGSLPQLKEQELREVGSGRTYFNPVAGPEPGKHRLWMALNLVERHPEAGMLMAELKPESVWQAEDLGTNSLWVTDSVGRVLFASERGIDLPSEVRGRVAQANSGELAWSNGDSSFVGAFWRIPVKTLFAGPDMIIVLAQPQALAFAAMEQFSQVYPPVIALAVLIVAYLSTRLIAKYLTPLERLKVATLKIAEGDFGCRVKIASGDEFQSLGDSFNNMTRRLGSQFDILATMAEIDRNILSALNAEDIIETALGRLPGILSCDLISVARFEPDTYAIRDIRTRRGDRIPKS